MLFISIVIFSILVHLSQESQLPCCKNLYLFATKVLEENQGGLLGKYTHEGVYNDRPYFVKSLYDVPYYFYYKENGTNGNFSPGWTVSSSLGANSLYISTRSGASFSECPVGLNGAYDRDKDLDDTFVVECDSEAVRDKCCSKVWVNASGPIFGTHFLRLGLYNLSGKFNGHPLFYMTQYNFSSYLYFRKKGVSTDGWTINSEPGLDSYSITTRDRSPCPQHIQLGYDRDKKEDESFSIQCDHEEESERDPSQEMHSASTQPFNFNLMLWICSLLLLSSSNVFVY